MLFGLLNPKHQNQQTYELIETIENVIYKYSYKEGNFPDFPGFFAFIAQRFKDEEDCDILCRVISLLSDIGGYRCGISVGRLIEQVEPISIKLLSNQNILFIKACVEFYRKVARITGPIFIFNIFVKPNLKNDLIKRSLAILVHQLINDARKFDFKSSDFKDWIHNLADVVSIGPRVIQVIQQRVSDFEEFDHIPELSFKPSDNSNNNNLKPVNQNHVKIASGVTNNNANVENPTFQGIKSQFRKTMPAFHKVNRPNTQGPIFQLTPKQQQIRKFNDKPFDENENINEIVESARIGITSKEWDDRCSAYNLSRRILKYSSASFNDDDVHEIVTATLDDVTGARAALSLAAIGAIQELFINKKEVMELELARVMPILLRLHAKTAQFFEAALEQCCNIIVTSMPSKRFCSVLLAIGDSKASKVQTAISKYYCDSITKCSENNERFFSKSSDELFDLVKALSNLLNGSSQPTRQDAKKTIHQLYLIYKDDLLNVVQRTLNDHDANAFLNFI